MRLRLLETEHLWFVEAGEPVVEMVSATRSYEVHWDGVRVGVVRKEYDKTGLWFVAAGLDGAALVDLIAASFRDPVDAVEFVCERHHYSKTQEVGS